MPAIPIDHWHQAQLAKSCNWQLTAHLSHLAHDVTVLDVRRVGEDGIEVLTDYGWKRAVSVSTEQQLTATPIDRQREDYLHEPNMLDLRA